MAKKVVIIGGGASGLMAAITAAHKGACVTVIEHKDKIGKKILMTGNGKCNLTNVSDIRGKYYGEDIERIYKILEQFPVEKTRAFFQQIGLYTKEKRDGGVYPVSEQAASVVDVLKAECEYCGVEIIADTEVLDIIPEQDGGIIHIETSIREKVTATKSKKGANSKKVAVKTVIVGTEKKSISYDRLIIATGGQAAAVSGSDGSGYRIAKKLGHSVIKPLPALVQLLCEGDYFKEIAGVRAQAALELYVCGELCAREEGELQLTDYGISGIPVFQFSRIVARELYEQQTGIKKEEKDSIIVKIDFLKALSQDEITKLIEKKEIFSYKTIETFLSGIINKKLTTLICRMYNWKDSVRLEQLSEKEFMAMIEHLQNFKVIVKGTNSYDSAQVCSGGIPLEEIQDTMESQICPHIYFAGEILDCDGICGGYNLQWAWTTGRLAGEYSAIE